MDTTAKYQLVRELERIKGRESRSGSKRRVLWIAVAQFLIAGEITTLAIKTVDKSSSWLVFLFSILSISLIVSGIYAIITSTMDSRLRAVMQAVLASREPQESTDIGR